jgi:hypothetical protein
MKVTVVGEAPTKLQFSFEAIFSHVLFHVTLLQPLKT